MEKLVDNVPAAYLDSLFSLDGKIVVFTGATGVLGSVMCKSLARAGASVVVVGRRKEVAQQVALDIESQGGAAFWYTADVCLEEQLVELKEVVHDKYGQIDILVNAAGGNLPGATIPPDKNFFNLSLNDFRNVVT